MAIPVNDDACKRRKLVGHDNFVRHNPLSDKYTIHRFHHIELYTADATTTARRLQHGLGLTLVAKSDASTGNSTCTSLVLKSGDLTFVVTAPQSLRNVQPTSSCPLPGYNPSTAYDFIRTHGLAVRSVGLVVSDAAEAYQVSIQNGGVGVLEPQVVTDAQSSTSQTVAEVKAYGDVVLRFVSGDVTGPFLANYHSVEGPVISYGLRRLDHCVGNVPNLFEATDYLMAITGFHEFSEFTADDVGTVDSGLNSMVLANNSEAVLMPVNEPTFGTKRQSQIQTYLEHNEGPGVQHLALKTDDIFATMRQMRAQTDSGGLEFMPRASDAYYRSLPDTIGDALTPAQYKEVEELGLLVDRDDQGVLLQIFTKPIGDRPTLFFEIIQRVGCEATVEVPVAGGGVEDIVEQAAGCGGFGKGNFRELFKSIERFEIELNVCGASPECA